MSQFDHIHRSLDRLGIRISIWVFFSILTIAVVVAAIALSTGEKGLGKATAGAALALVMALFFFWAWYDLQIRPVLPAERILAPLAAYLRLAPTTPRQSRTRSIREERDRTKRFVEGLWEESLVAIAFDPPTGSDENSSSKGNTSVFLTASLPLAGKALLERWKGITVLASRLFAFLGQSPVLKRLSDDFGAYGEDTEIARLFTPAVLALVRAFPRDTYGPTVEGNEIRMEWESLETDPKVIEAAFHLLKTISDAGAAER